jgi:hypothetical protein
MKRFLTLLLPLLAGMLATAQSGAEKRIPLDALRDKIAGGWAGQMIGVSYGAPTEFRSDGRINESVLPPWTPARVSNSLGQDDLYVDMTFAAVLDKKGLDATTEDFGNMFRDAKYRLWHANLAGRRNLKRGIAAADSGLPRYNAHADDIDFQIESDFIGLMAPGLYQSAIDLGLRAGRVMNYGDGIYGGIFVSCMYSAAFFEKEPRQVVERGLACIPARSPYAMLISDVLQWSRQYPDDWKKVWQLLEDKWDRDDLCPEGALKPFNIDAKLNGGYIALGLLYGKGDFGRSIDIATRAGQDSDCNPASTGGIVGVILGYRAIPDKWKSGIDAIADKKFSFTDFSFRTIVISSYNRALALAKRNGATERDSVLVLPVHEPKPPKLEVWNAGKPVERIAVADARWSWKGNWSTTPLKGRDVSADATERRTGEKGAEASVAFQGTGVVVVGPYLPDGGKLQVYLDGKADRILDVNSDDSNSRSGESVWHAFGLSDGKHTVRLVVLGEPYADASGTAVAIDGLILYR